MQFAYKGRGGTKDNAVIMAATGGGTFCYKRVEYEFIDETKKNLEDLVCPICHEILNDPLITNCGHLFCGRCLQRGGSRVKNCPVCREEYTSMSDQFHARKINGLKVKCSNAGKGCEWSGELRDAESHVKTSCQYAEVLCKNGCGEHIEQLFMLFHELVKCPKRPYSCPYCEREGTFTDIVTSHFTACTLLPVACPTGCGSEIPRNRLLSHLDECAKRPVKCKYSNIGCPAVLEAKDMEQHLEAQKDKHLELSMDAIVKLTACVSQLQLLHSSHTSAQQLAGPVMPLSRPWLENISMLPFPPRIVKLVGYEEKKINSTIWHSEPFFTHPGGYKMCVQVYTNGFKDAEGQYLSAYTCLLRGEMDDKLQWPLLGKISMFLLNQIEDDNHVRLVADYRKDAPDRVSARVQPPKNKSVGNGQPRILKLSSLADPAKPSVKYLQDDCLYFKVDTTEVVACE